jgi:hypothetical protein
MPQNKKSEATGILIFDFELFFGVHWLLHIGQRVNRD